MSGPDPLPFTAPLAAYDAEARAVFDALRAGEDAVAWRFKWMHPRFRGRRVDEVRTAALDMDDARLLVALEHAFDDWASLARFTEAVTHDGPERRFEQAVDAVITRNATELRQMVDAHPDLVRARSPRRHRATLLHYVAANGVEGYRQRTPPNVVEVATILLDAGAEPDALADMYDTACTTMSMLLSSEPPHAAGLQLPLAELLLARGAALEGPGRWGSAVMTGLLFGYSDAARALAARLPPNDDLPLAAGLGRAGDVVRLLPTASADQRHLALALAAQHGHAEVVRLLLDAGEDPDRYNPDGCHSHATPLHQAVWGGHVDVVRLLVERGARLDIRDTIFDGTPRGWAEYGKRVEILPLLEGAPG